jgi:hypothetical protein
MSGLKNVASFAAMLMLPLAGLNVACGAAEETPAASQVTSTEATPPPVTSGVQDGVKLGKAYVSGENPVIRLLDKEGGTALTVASFWRVIWSPVGQGHVIYVTTGDGKSPGDLRLAIADNQKLHEYLVDQILGTFDKTYVERPFTFAQGTCRSSGDTLKEWKETCKSDKYTIELAFRDFYEPFQLDTPVGGPRNPFGVTSFFIPAKAADVIINGTRAAGNVYPQKRGAMESSTAFLAFSESWIK